MAIGDRLREIRESNKLSQPALAEQLGVKSRTYGTYERNESRPDSDFLKNICTKFCINPKWLLFGEGPMKIEDQPDLDAGVSENNTSSAPPLDMELFTNTIRVVETGLAKKNIHLPPDKKAQLIALMYEYFSEMDREVEEGTVERYLKLVS